MNPKPIWRDIQRAARHCLPLAQAIELVESGAATREEALIVAAIQLADERAELVAREVEQWMAHRRTAGVQDFPAYCSN